MFVQLVKRLLPVLLVNRVKKSLLRFVAWRERRLLSSHFRWLEKRVAQVRRKEEISVLFEVWTVSMWKSESVYRLMESMTRFKPYICVIPLANDVSEKEREENFQSTIAYFRNKGYNIVTAGCRAEAKRTFKPDIFFICQPYDFSLMRLLTDRMRDTLYCYVPYAIRNTKNIMAYNNISQNKYLFNFVENEYIKEIASELMDNGGRNVFVSGFPLFDLLQSDSESVWKSGNSGKKRVIWAPHWSVNPDRAFHFVVSTFTSVAEDMLRLANEYRDTILFAFKPHPFLYAALCLHPQWGKERTDDYFQKWRDMPNTQLVQGDYWSLFVQSDALIHDCGSFIVEYIAFDKPCLYLLNKNGGVQFNEVTQAALDCHDIGYDIGDVTQFMNRLLAGTADMCKKQQRADFVRNYIRPPHGKSAAQNIVDAILGEQR